jgi:hypothetical protein
MGNNDLKDERQGKNSSEGHNQSVDDDDKKLGGKMLGPQIFRILEVRV